MKLTEQEKPLVWLSNGACRFVTVGEPELLRGTCLDGSAPCAFADAVERNVGHDHGVHCGCKGERGIEVIRRFKEWKEQSRNLIDALDGL